MGCIEILIAFLVFIIGYIVVTIIYSLMWVALLTVMLTVVAVAVTIVVSPKARKTAEVWVKNFREKERNFYNKHRLLGLFFRVFFACFLLLLIVQSYLVTESLLGSSLFPYKL